MPAPLAQTPPPAGTPLSSDQLEQFWQGLYPEQVDSAIVPPSLYIPELLAKAAPDECYNGIGAPYTGTVPDCPDGQPKVNQAYVWGMTAYSTPTDSTIWFGTAPNVHCLVLGSYLGLNSPFETDSYVCEFGDSQIAQAAPALGSLGDRRPAKLYIYDLLTDSLTDVTPAGPPASLRLNNTIGIRSATTFGDYVFFAGPAFTGGINIFLFDAANRTLIAAGNVPGYTNIRKWLVVDGVLYTAVGKANGGAVLRYTGDPTDPATRFQFEEVGNLDADGAEIALHDGRLFVNTWPSSLLTPTVAGLWMSPEIQAGGLTTADAPNWQKVFSYDEYEPDPVLAFTYGGGALMSYGGDLFWGTMHVPFLSTLAHFNARGGLYDPIDGPTEEEILEALLATQRSITIFQGRNFGTPEQAVEVAYGLPELPAFDAVAIAWYLEPNGIGLPKYGPAGFGNFFNNYTWSMSIHDNQLFVGTMDWSYLVGELLQEFLNELVLPPEIQLQLPVATYGADLFVFTEPSAPAWPFSLNGVGNYSSYGIRNMLSDASGVYLGMANPMNLLTDPYDDKPEGGWELLHLLQFRVPIQANVAGNGAGTITSDPPGIDCPTSCLADFKLGQEVYLTATPAIGSSFTRWEGSCSGDGLCGGHLLLPKTVTAIFTLNTYTATVTKEGDGAGSVVSSPPGIVCGDDCSESYDYGTLLELTPTAEAGSVFGGWSGACSGLGACAVTITETTQVTATFLNNRFALNVALTGDGAGSVASTPAGIACGADCSALYDKNTQVLLTPTSADGSIFNGWSGACAGVGACSVNITQTTYVTATFLNNRFPLTVVITGTGSGVVSSVPTGIDCSQGACTAGFDSGTEVALSAVGVTGSSFVGWSGACSGEGACAVTVDPGGAVVTATFNLDPQQASIEVEGELVPGSPISLTAILPISPILECTWDFGDGQTESCVDTVAAAGVAEVDAALDITVRTTHVYTEAHTYIVTVTASNDAGVVAASRALVLQTPTAEAPIAAPAERHGVYLPLMVK